VHTQTQIDPVISFRNALGEAARGTIINVQRKSLVMEIYNPYSIVQVSEVLSDVTVRIGTKSVYFGKAVVVSMVNTGLTAMVSMTLTDEWLELSGDMVTPAMIGSAVKQFVGDWVEREPIRGQYQIAVNQMRSFLSEVSRWVEQVDLSESLPKHDGKLQLEYFQELATPLIMRMREYGDALGAEAGFVDDVHAASHRAFAQAALHPLMLRAPFVFRAYSKPMGYAGDYQMVRQILSDPREGPSTYFQIVNAAFLQTTIATAHRNRIDLLHQFLQEQAQAARVAGRQFRILNVGCGPAEEIQRFLKSCDDPSCLSFVLLDFNKETLSWTQRMITELAQSENKEVAIEYVHDSVHELLKRRMVDDVDGPLFDAVYCAGLFDYLSDRVCTRLISYFASRTRHSGKILVTNVFCADAERFSMEHLLEWYLVYRNQAAMQSLVPKNYPQHRIYADKTGANIFAEVIVVRDEIR